MFVFFLHVGSDLRLTDPLATDLRILIHCLTVCTDLSVRLKDLPRDAVKSSSKDPAEKSPDCQISNGHLVSNIKPYVVYQALACRTKSFTSRAILLQYFLQSCKVLGKCPRAEFGSCRFLLLAILDSHGGAHSILDIDVDFMNIILTES